MPHRIRSIAARTSLFGLLVVSATGCRSYGGPMAHERYAMAPPLPREMALAMAGPEREDANTEHYKDYGVNPFVDASKDRLSTFAIDVDTASYSVARRKLTDGALPPKAAVRVEEFVNSFDYHYDAPTKGAFAVHFAAAPSPSSADRQLLRVGLQTKRPAHRERPAAHLVYLVDTSGSMQSPDKLGLAKESLRLMTKKLRPGDTVALCTYAGDTREVLPPTGMNERQKILDAIEELTAGGGTGMSSGMDTAYALANRTLKKGEINRVIVLSDGDANIGPSSHDEILASISRYKDQGITLSTVGFGQGNYKDTMMEQLADKGDGNYAYIDSPAQARKVFVEQLDSMLEVVARDVKIQVDFDPTFVRRYRLVGYENRDVADKDFRNDRVDGGEVGAGHAVTALYEIELAPNVKAASLATVRVRYKAPEGGAASEDAFTMPADASYAELASAPRSFRLAVAVATFAENLRESPEAPGLDQVLALARQAADGSEDAEELVRLVERATKLGGRRGRLVAAQ